MLRVVEIKIVKKRRFTNGKIEFVSSKVCCHKLHVQSETIICCGFLTLYCELRLQVFVHEIKVRLEGVFVKSLLYNFGILRDDCNGKVSII